MCRASSFFFMSNDAQFERGAIQETRILTGSAFNAPCAVHKTRHQNVALRDRAPESDFRDYFSDTETKLDEGNTAMSRHFERGPL
jgi:hypothetical protein